MVVDAEQSSGECEDFTESDQHGGVYDAEGWHKKTCDEQRTADYDKQDCANELQGEFLSSYRHNIGGVELVSFQNLGCKYIFASLCK